MLTWRGCIMQFIITITWAELGSSFSAQGESAMLPGMCSWKHLKNHGWSFSTFFVIIHNYCSTNNFVKFRELITKFKYICLTYLNNTSTHLVGSTLSSCVALFYSFNWPWRHLQLLTQSVCSYHSKPLRATCTTMTNALFLTRHRYCWWPDETSGSLYKDSRKLLLVWDCSLLWRRMSFTPYELLLRWLRRWEMLPDGPKEILLSRCLPIYSSWRTSWYVLRSFPFNLYFCFHRIYLLIAMFCVKLDLLLNLEAKLISNVSDSQT